MENNFPLTVLEVLNFTAELFKHNGIDDARLNSELILCDVLNCDRVKLYLNFDKPLSFSETEQVKNYSARRSNREPVQHIIGKTSFFGFDFKVNNKVLIPRPETELLIEKILDDIKRSGKSIVSIFEIGTGSGCIPVALAKSLKKESVSFHIFSIDISHEAVETAQENLALNDLTNESIKIIRKDIFEIERLTKPFDYIVSNPPYISKDEFDKLEPEVRDFEPDIALTDKGDGLKFFERIFLIASDSEFIGKVFCEIGYGQKEGLLELMNRNKLNDHKFYNDYNKIPRILEIAK